MASRTITDTASELIPRNALRESFVVQNEDSLINIFIKKERTETPTVSSTDHDHRLGPLNSLSVNTQDDGHETVQDRWTVIAASGTPRISLFETERIQR